jgi:phosphopantetheinyl transferase (holo-ACP synthase)
MTATRTEVVIVACDDAAQLPLSASAGTFTPAEAAYCAGARGGERAAARLAAKRAVLAVLGLTGRSAMADVEVLPGRHDDCETTCAAPALGHPPRLVLRGEAARAVETAGRVVVSLTHDRSAAAAIAVLMSNR